MPYNQKTGLGIVATLLATAAPVTGAWAQTAAQAPASTPAPAASAPPADQGIADIVVTAQRRSESLQKVPIAVVPISQSAIATAGVTSSLDLPRLAPGLTSSPTTANSFFVPYIRGVGSNSPATGNDSSIALYIDGIYQSDKSANVLDLADIDRIEVLKGPQGTLFGRNATGGAINIITLQPQAKLSENGEVSFQRFDRWTAKAYVTGALSDNLFASISYNHIGGGKYLENVGPDKPGKFGYTDSNYVSVKLRFDPGTRFEATAAFSYTDRKTDDLGSNLYPVPGTTPVGVLIGGQAAYGLYQYAGSPNFFETSAYRASLKAKYSLDGFDIVSLSGFVYTTDTTNLDYDGTSANVLYFNETQGTRDFSQELQLISNNKASALQWVLGGYYFKGTARVAPLNLNQGVAYNDTPSDSAAFAPGGSITSVEARGPTRALAAYGQATYALTDNTHLTGGLRYTSERRGYTFTVSGVGQIAPGFFSPSLIPLLSDDGQLHKTFDKLTWRLAVDHQFTSDVMAYASWNRGFKSGTYNLNDFTPNQVPVKPERLDAYEIGLKSQFFDRKVQLNLAAFYYNYIDIQVDTIVASGSGASTTILQNAASERNYGLDVETIYQPIRDFQIRANASLLDAKYRDYPTATAFVPDAFGNGTQSIVDASGQTGLFAPKWSFNLGADYTIHLENGSKVLLSSSYFRTAGFKVGIGPDDRIYSYDSLGASATYTLPGDHFYVRIYGNNLTNRKVIGTVLSAVKDSRDEILPITYGVAAGFRF